jgi:NAD-dependent SIR2 family protein deacetylase
VEGGHVDPDPAGVQEAATVLAEADAVVVTAGAGIGVDSGLPDFRGDEGFWRAYPPYARLGLSFVHLANPDAFRRDPELAWGFYGHRRALYRRTRPHAGFDVLRELAGFVFTSNVDGQFQAAGFDPAALLECHGTLAYDQCLRGCGSPPFPADERDVEVDADTMRARHPLPSCPSCAGLARPNVLLFGDASWDDRRSREQEARLRGYLARVASAASAARPERAARAAPAGLVACGGLVARGGLVVLEVGAGTAVPTVRWFGESLVRQAGARLIRVNPRDGEVPPGHVSVRGGAAASLLAIRAALTG